MKNNSYNNYKTHLDKTIILSKYQYKIYENYYRRNILRLLPQNRNVKIVDLGCGLGHFLYFLKNNNYFNISGIDLVKENVEFCKNRGFNVKQDNLINYIFSIKEKSDVFILSNVLEHFFYSDIVKIINSLYDLLNKNGIIIIIVPNCNNIYGIATYFSDITHKSPLTEKSLEDLIIKTKISTYSFYNLIIYPNIFFINILLKFYNNFLFSIRKIKNLANGQKPYKVQSKNLLCILKK